MASRRKRSNMLIRTSTTLANTCTGGRKWRRRSVTSNNESPALPVPMVMQLLDSTKTMDKSEPRNCAANNPVSEAHLLIEICVCRCDLLCNGRRWLGNCWDQAPGTCIKPQNMRIFCKPRCVKPVPQRAEIAAAKDLSQ